MDAIYWIFTLLEWAYGLFISAAVVAFIAALLQDPSKPGFADWIERTPWAMRIAAAGVLLLSPILYTLALWNENSGQIKDSYKRVWVILKTGKDPE